MALGGSSTETVDKPPAGRTSWFRHQELRRRQKPRLFLRLRTRGTSASD